jgi:hypothetical protein
VGGPLLRGRRADPGDPPRAAESAGGAFRPARRCASSGTPRSGFPFSSAGRPTSGARCALIR